MMYNDKFVLLVKFDLGESFYRAVLTTTKCFKSNTQITNDPAYNFDNITVADSDSKLCSFLESKMKLEKGSVEAS